MSDILEFQGPHRWLSNFWPAQVLLDGHIYHTVENAYQAAKFHPSGRAIFRTCTPGEAKRLGKVQPGDWVLRRVPVMRGLIEQKFSRGSELGEWLLNTGDCKIVEGNAWGDMFWGVCRGKGINTLGHLIMEQRAYLRMMEAV